ncbi:MAG: hypothetical protein LIR50_19275 [Bacillota bacterium]|nr:hypothetical protein [Bacillota bacterium]
MIKFVKEYKSGCSRFEITTIEGTKAVHEFLFNDNKAVWKTYEANIVKDYKWSNSESYIKHLKNLGFKELKEYTDNLIWVNPNTGKEFKQYEF